METPEKSETTKPDSKSVVVADGVDGVDGNETPPKEGVDGNETPPNETASFIDTLLASRSKAGEIRKITTKQMDKTTTKRIYLMADADVDGCHIGMSWW